MKNRIIAALKGLYLPSRVCALIALLCAALLPAPARAAKPLTTNEISDLATDAFIWGYGPEYIYRVAQYNTLIGAPFNSFKYSTVPAAWNNEASPAGDGSVVYVTAFINLAETNLVLTVPPSSTNYYVVAYYDAYANSIGSIGTRTTPSDTYRSFLLVGPKSKYASQPKVTIRGYEYEVMASDTDLNFCLIRVLANTLIDPTNPTSVPRIAASVAHKLALNTQYEFETNGHLPVYPASFVTPPPTSAQTNAAAPWQNVPTDAVEFFNQLGTNVANNPIPNRGTGLSGTTVSNLPPYVLPQYGATSGDKYLVPSYGQKKDLDLYAPIGLTKKGFSIPAGWGPNELQALQAGYDRGQQTLSNFVASAGATTNTYWGIVNDIVGNYPNNFVGYLYRSVIVVEGGVANVPLDAVYPTLTGIPCPLGTTNICALDGNNTYKLTFMPPTSTTNLPADGIYPPMVPDSSGHPKGFWSITVYAPDPTDANAPFIPQTSLLNTNYSIADSAVLAVDTVSNTITVRYPTWGPLVASTPILFGGEAEAYGLTQGTIYYVAGTPSTNTNVFGLEYTFPVSTQWLQDISPGQVPIQNSGHPGPPVDLVAPAVPVPLSYGPVKPVCQLGSSQLAAGQLATNVDGSLTLWFGPSLPTNAPVSNWLPTPSTSYYQPLYTNHMSTLFQVTLRMYYPTPGNKPPSILPYPGQRHPFQKPLHESYVPPLPQLAQ